MSEPTDSRALALLRAEVAPPPEAQARVFANLAKSIPALGRGDGGDGGESGSGASGNAAGGAARGASGVGGAKALASLVTAFVIGGGVGAAIYARAPRALVALPSVDRIVVLAPAHATTAAIDPVAASPAVSSTSPASERAAPAPTIAPSGSQARPPSRSAQLDEERALLDIARTALVRDDAGAALASLDQHTRRFPRPLLAEEREAIAVQALVKVGRVAEARARGAAFQERWPASIFGTAVRAALASIP